MNTQELIKILVCPKCKGTLRINEDPYGFACDQCSLLYPVREDIPVMLVDEALPFEKSGD